MFLAKNTNTMKTLVGVLLLICAYALLYPGLTLPMLSVSGSVEKIELVDVGRDLIRQSPKTPDFLNDLVDLVIDALEIDGTINVFDKTRSILGTATELYKNNHVPVAILIVLFSIVVPLIKALLLLALLLPVNPRIRSALLWFNNNASKWSMVDVFVIAIFVAFLAGNGMQDSGGLVQFTAKLGQGFWYFLGYCLVAIVGTQVLNAGIKDKHPHA